MLGLLEKEMATHSSVLAWRIPGMGAWWAAVYGVAQSRTRLKRLGGGSSSMLGLHCFVGFSLASRGYSLVAGPWFLIAVTFLVAEHRL